MDNNFTEVDDEEEEEEELETVDEELQRVYKTLDAIELNNVLETPNEECITQSQMFMYQTQKKIWNTVRVPASLYQNDLAAVSVFQRPVLKTRLNWNQMSDRALPHGQPGKPASYGVDVKHNSYARYYNRLKGKGPARAQRWPQEFGKENLPFNYAYPIYGNKLFKTNILGMKCVCRKYIV